MNGLSALAATAMEGASVVRRPSWQAEADPAARHRVRRLADNGPAPVPLHLTLDVSAARLASPNIGLRR